MADLNVTFNDTLNIDPFPLTIGVDDYSENGDVIDPLASTADLIGHNVMKVKIKHWKWEPPYHESEWIACEIVHLACMSLAIYILYALIHFYAVQPRRHNYSGRSSGNRWLEKMCILSVIVTLLRFVNNQVLLVTGWYSRDRCSILLNVSIALYFLALHPVYFFLWIRQRIFYSNRALKHLYNRLIRFLSLFTIFCFFVDTGVSMVLFVVDRKNSASGRVCGDHYEEVENVIYRARDSNRSLPELPDGDFIISERSPSNASVTSYAQGLKVNTVAGIIAGVIQISFLILFLYPIMDNKLRAVRNLNMRCHHALFKLIRRAFVLSGVCIFSDVAIALGVKSVYAHFPKAIFAPLAMYDINLIVNIVCIVATFRRWRRMLFPCLYNCFGRRLVRNSTRKNLLERRSAALDTTNGGNARSVAPNEENDGDNEENEQEERTNVNKPVVIDALLDSDDDILDTMPNGVESNRMEQLNHNGNGNVKPNIQYYSSTSPSKRMSRKSSKKDRSGRRYTVSANIKPSAPGTITMINTTPFCATSRFSLRSKKANNVVTTKLVVKSEAYVWMGSQTKDERG